MFRHNDAHLLYPLAHIHWISYDVPFNNKDLLIHARYLFPLLAVLLRVMVRCVIAIYLSCKSIYNIVLADKNTCILSMYLFET